MPVVLEDIAPSPLEATDRLLVRRGAGPLDHTMELIAAQDVADLVSVAWADITGKPATFPPDAHNQAWSTITATPTTLAGYGITDAATAETRGTATIDFGAAPGTNMIETAVSTPITAGARISVWFQGDASADHNAYEHQIIFPARIGLTAGSIIAGVGFTIYASTELRLTGDVTCRWQWSA